MDDDYSSDEDADLADILMSSSVSSRFEKTPHRFIPEGKFDKIVTREAVRDALYSKTEVVDAVLIDYIVEDARKLFAVTVLTYFNKPEYLIRAMCLFRDRNFSDSIFPIEDPPISKDGQFDLSAHPFAKMGKPWSRTKIHIFCNQQWKLLAPVFSTVEFNHDLGMHILPFIARNEEASEGSFGFVRRYTIHPDHIQSSSTTRSKVGGLVLCQEYSLRICGRSIPI